MKIQRERFVFQMVLLTGLWLAALIAPAAAQDGSTVSIVVIDTQQIYREATSVKGLQEHINKQRTDYQDEIRKKEEALRGAGQELERQRALLAAESYAAKRRELEEQVAALQREVQLRKRGLEKLFAEGMNRVRNALVEISQEIAKAREADLVIEKSAIVLVKPDLEITQEVLAGLNKTLPTIDIKSLQK